MFHFDANVMLSYHERCRQRNAQIADGARLIGAIKDEHSAVGAVSKARYGHMVVGFVIYDAIIETKQRITTTCRKMLERRAK